MDSIASLLHSNSWLLLFLVVGLGFAVGHIKIKGFSFGLSAILFVGLILGAIIPGLELPEFVSTFGLILFVYCIGIQTGPSFFSSFNKQKLTANILVICMFALSAGLIFTFRSGFNIPEAISAGLFCGAHTNTPALAAATDMIKAVIAQTSDIAPEQAKLLLSQPVVGYGISYPIGVLGVIFLFFIMGKIWKVDMEKEALDASANQSKASRIQIRNFVVSNPGIFGKDCRSIKRDAHAEFGLSRIKKKKSGTIMVATSETVLEKGDIVVAIGTAKSLEKALQLFGGEDAEEHIDEVNDIIQSRKVFISNKEVVGKRLIDLKIPETYQVMITRIVRGEVDLIAHSSSILEMGDQVTLVGAQKNLADVSKYLGNSMMSLAHLDFFSISFGIVLGLLFGQLPIPLPMGGIFRFGNAGGPLLVALVLGKLGRTGPISWVLPKNGNFVLREFGLMLFLAAVGVKAGGPFISTITSEGGIQLILIGAFLTFLITLLALIIAVKILKIPFSGAMGLISGMQTQPACLAYANDNAKSELPNIWYATVYPTATIIKIIIAQLLISGMR
ncbi:MAG: TrkA C-terminal domain-containing protein [bacterium]